eukprot:10893576-Lingulodinium_polyedra.AAC.1
MEQRIIHGATSHAYPLDDEANERGSARLEDAPIPRAPAGGAGCPACAQFARQDSPNHTKPEGMHM